MITVGDDCGTEEDSGVQQSPHFQFVGLTSKVLINSLLGFKLKQIQMARVLGGILCPLACFSSSRIKFQEKTSLRSISVFSVTAAHWHCKQWQGPCWRWCLGVRVRWERLFGLVAAAARGRGREVVAHFIGALPLLESLSSNSQGARTHRQEHNERSQQQGHHWPEDAVQQDTGVMRTV